MKHPRYLKFATTFALLIGLVSGCAVQTPHIAHYDFGSPRQADQSKTDDLKMKHIRIARMDAPAWLNNHFIHYRLNYDNERQIRPYANNQWVAPPADLFEQRLKARLARTGTLVLSETNNQVSAPALQLEILDFIQLFDDANHSRAQISVRITLFDQQLPLAQTTFVRQQVAPTPDASGGAQALAAATDALIDDLLVWIQVQTTK